MGLLDFLGRGQLSEAKIKKVADLAANPFAQPDVRMKEMQRLLGDGSAAALRGVLKRFASNASGGIADEEEKQWLENELAELGQDAVEPLRDFIKHGDKLTYALRAFERIVGLEEARRFFLEVLEAYGPDDYRAVEAKLQLVLQLLDKPDPSLYPRLTPFLRDHSDDVVWAVMEALDKAATAGELTAQVEADAAARLAEMILADIGAPRIQRRAAELVASREWSLPGEVSDVVAFLADDFFLDKKRFVRRRAPKKG